MDYLMSCDTVRLVSVRDRRDWERRLRFSHDFIAVALSALLREPLFSRALSCFKTITP